MSNLISMSLIDAALAYLEFGYSIVVVGNDKKAIHYWQKYQTSRIKPSTLKYYLHKANAFGIAIVCGNISKNLEVIDIDEKNVVGKNLFEQFLLKLDQYSPELITRLGIAATKNKGFHLIYTCDKIDPSIELAKRQSTTHELSVNLNHKIKVLIETRGNGGYVLVFPTPGYQFIQHDLFHIPHIKESERSLLFRIARSFNLYRGPKPKPFRRNTYETTSQSPFIHFNESGDLFQLLEKHGWIYVKTDGQRTFFRRPGETDHDTSADYHEGLGLFTPKTSSTEFKRDKGYQPYAVFAILECGGDFTKAVKELLKRGYGVAYKDRKQF